MGIILISLSHKSFFNKKYIKILSWVKWLKHILVRCMVAMTMQWNDQYRMLHLRRELYSDTYLVLTQIPSGCIAIQEVFVIRCIKRYIKTEIYTSCNGKTLLIFLGLFVSL